MLCIRCSSRQRILDDNNQCPTCRQELAKVSLFFLKINLSVKFLLTIDFGKFQNKNRSLTKYIVFYSLIYKT